jgi:hypothetical protein
MVRTRQTARKSTGSKAPRRQQKLIETDISDDDTSPVVVAEGTIFVPSHDAIMKKDAISHLEIQLGFSTNKEQAVTCIRDLETFNFNDE